MSNSGAMSTMSNIRAVFIPKLIGRAENRLLAEVAAHFCGVLLISLLAQIVIHLPWTPVPITGQTFGVALTALLWGRNRGAAVMTSYLFAGAMGLPVFAAGSSVLLGASSGYLVGMFVASVIVGELADRGFTRSWGRAFLASYIGSFFIFLFGLIVLSNFVPHETLFISGLLPFLPGDFLKNLLASFIASRLSGQRSQVSGNK